MRRRLTLLAIVAAVAAVVTGGSLATSSSAASQIGYEAQSYAGFGAESSGGPITGRVPESKLWFNDGNWWAVMVSSGAGGAHDIYRLSGSAWTDTGVLVDSREATKEDVLSLGSTLYVVSRSNVSTSGPNMLRRFSYASGVYSLDTGFPVNVPGGGSGPGSDVGASAETVARDTAGTLWVAYVANRKMQVAHTTGSDTSWSAPYQIPNTQLTSLKGDIASIVSFTDAAGPAVGVMWSNQVTGSFDFAIHRDAAPGTSWSLETAQAGPNESDSQISLKTFEGRVYAAVKTSLTASTDPLVDLLVRSTTGTWSSYPVAIVQQNPTRPVLLIDGNHRQLYVFFTKNPTNPKGIFYKQSAVDLIGFPSAMTPVLQGANGEPIDNVTTMKDAATSASGIAIMASDGTNYWWNALNGGNTPPIAYNDSTSVYSGTSETITLKGSDAETCELTFSIVSGPVQGSLGSMTNKPCTPGAPNTDTAALSYTAPPDYTGTDTFTYKVNDGSLDSNSATITINIGINTPPHANDVTVSATSGTAQQITLSGSDAETCELTFSVVTAPSQGGVGSITNKPCTPGSPNQDTATINYTSPSGFTGQDTFTYKINDGALDSSTATVTVTVTSNSPPVAGNVTASASGGTPQIIILSGSDAETCELTFSIVGGPVHGSLGSITNKPCTPGSPNQDTATISYTATSGYNGQDTFTYKVNDGALDSSAATVTITATASLNPSSVTVVSGKLVSGNAASLAKKDGNYLRVNPVFAGGLTRATLWYGSITGVPTNVTQLRIAYSGLNTASCTQVISIYNWATAKWVTLDTRTVGTTEIDVTGLIPPGTPSSYVKSGSGEVRIEIKSSRNGSFTTSGDLLAVSF